MGYSPWGHKASNTTEQLTARGSLGQGDVLGSMRECLFSLINPVLLVQILSSQKLTKLI